MLKKWRRVFGVIELNYFWSILVPCLLKPLNDQLLNSDNCSVLFFFSFFKKFPTFLKVLFHNKMKEGRRSDGRKEGEYILRLGGCLMTLGGCIILFCLFIFTFKNNILFWKDYANYAFFMIVNFFYKINYICIDFLYNISLIGCSKYVSFSNLWIFSFFVK